MIEMRPSYEWFDKFDGIPIKKKSIKKKLKKKKVIK